MKKNNNEKEVSEEMNYIANILAKDMLERKCAWANRIGKLRKEQSNGIFFTTSPNSEFHKMCPNGLKFPMDAIEYIWSRVCRGDVALAYGEGDMCQVHWLVRIEDIEKDEQFLFSYFLAKFIYDNYGNEVFMSKIRDYISQPPIRHSFSQTPIRHFLECEGRDISFPPSFLKRIVSAIEDKNLSFKEKDGNVEVDMKLDLDYLVEDLWKKSA